MERLGPQAKAPNIKGLESGGAGGEEGRRGFIQIRKIDPRMNDGASLCNQKTCEKQFGEKFLGPVWAS